MVHLTPRSFFYRTQKMMVTVLLTIDFHYMDHKTEEKKSNRIGMT